MKRPSRVARVAAIASAGALVLAACGGGGDDEEAGGDTAQNMPVYFVDGNTADYSEDFDPGTLEGVKGTLPGAEASDEFKDRLLEVDPDLDSFAYGPESYDAVIVSALAAAVADNDSSKAIAQEMQGVSAPPGEQCNTYTDCLALIDEGEEIDYEGVSGPINFSDVGSPTAASVGIYGYLEDNTYEALTFQQGEITGDEAGDGMTVEGDIPEGDGEFVVGSLLPQTGDLAFLGPPEVAGVDLAVQEINEAGGVLGEDATHVQADSGDGTPNIAPAETDSLLAANADIIVGAASSSVSLSVIDKITNAGTLMISPANTSPEFDTYEDEGLYFRTAPSDVLQGRVLATLIAEDGARNVGILARQESYGIGLADNVEQFFTDAGGTVVAKELYAPDAANYTAEIDALAAADPDAIVVIGFDETLRIIPELIRRDIGPN